LLTCAHGDGGRNSTLPTGCSPDKSIGSDLHSTGLLVDLTCLQVVDATKCLLPALLELCSDETISYPEEVGRFANRSYSEKDWTASFRQCQLNPKLKQSRRTRLAVDGISARLSGVWARSSPDAAKRGVRDAGLEVGHIPRDHRSAVWSFIASDMSDRSSADLYSYRHRRDR
jgi:hypothetical protein